jgi:ubiquinone biosynthesis protein
MTFKPLPRTFRHLKRYHQIIRVLLNYGFNDLVNIASRNLQFHFGGKFAPPTKPKIDKNIGSRAERLRSAIEELGPTFIKMGQILSMRSDIIPKDIAFELQKLQDEVEPISFEEIEKVISEEIEGDPYKIFSKIERESLAAASISQVHRAKLADSSDVVIKVQRPGVREVIDADIEILKDLTRVLQKYFREQFVQNPIGVVEEFDKTIHRELDFRLEGRNISRFKQFFQNDPEIFVPHYYPDYSTSKILVMDYVDGIKASNIQAIEKAGLDREIIARNGAHISFRQIFEFGFFHADPHAGNVMVLPRNVIALLDYGMVGQIDEKTIDLFGDLLIGFIRKDVLRILRALEKLGVTFNADTRVLKSEIENIINNYYGSSLQEIQITTLMNDFFDITKRYNITVPSHLSLALKTLITVEGLVRILYPDFDIVTEMQPFISKVILRKYDPRRMIKEGSYVIDDIIDLASELPKNVQTIVNKAASGNFSIQFEHRNLQNLVDELKRSSTRLSTALIIAALVVGSSLLIQVPIGKTIFGYPVMGVIGYLIAALLGLNLIWNIFRSRK